MMWMSWQKIWMPSLAFALILYLFLRKKKPNLSWLSGRCVLITGAGSGLGCSLATLLNSLGAKVILCGRNVDRLNEVAQSLPRKDVKSWTYRLDLSDMTSMNNLAKQIAEEIDCPVHILINNAGQSFRGKVLNTELNVHEQLMKVNYLGHVALTMAWLKHLRRFENENPSNLVKDCAVFISSIQGRFSIPFRSAYSAPKHAIQAFADCLRAEESGSADGVRVLVASPGYIQTNLSRNALRDTGAKHGQMDKTTASGMSPDEVAMRIVTALSEGKHEITIAPSLHKFVIILRAVWPSIFFRIMSSKASRDDPY